MSPMTPAARELVADDVQGDVKMQRSVGCRVGA
jgi:hypothetical protein